MPKNVFPSFISRKEFSVKPNAFILIIKPSCKYKLSFTVNTNLGAVSDIIFN
jgi:hypothetical protein